MSSISWYLRSFKAVYCVEKLGVPMNKVNPNGGAIALGTPTGLHRGAPGGHPAQRAAAPGEEVRLGGRRRRGSINLHTSPWPECQESTGLILELSTRIIWVWGRLQLNIFLWLTMYFWKLWPNSQRRRPGIKSISSWLTFCNWIRL